MQPVAPVVVPDYERQARCHVCSAPERDVPNGAVVANLIDELLLVPRTYTAIMRVIEPLMTEWPDGARISSDSVMRHGQRHLAWEKAAVREVAERRAGPAGKLDDVAGRMLTAATVLEVIQQRGFDLVISGESSPSVKDTLQATAALRELEREAEGQFSAAELLSQMDRVIGVVREFIPEELWPQVCDRIDGGVAPPAPPPSSPDPVWDEIVGEVSGGTGARDEVRPSATTKG